jgi:hypothetical protein
MEARPRKLLDQVRDAVRLKHYFYRTEQSYVGWIRRYILSFMAKNTLRKWAMPRWRPF